MHRPLRWQARHEARPLPLHRTSALPLHRTSAPVRRKTPMISFGIRGFTGLALVCSVQVSTDLFFCTLHNSELIFAVRHSSLIQIRNSYWPKDLVRCLDSFAFCPSGIQLLILPAESRIGTTLKLWRRHGKILNKAQSRLLKVVLDSEGEKT
jgi:hypothetical protein